MQPPPPPPMQGLAGQYVPGTPMFDLPFGHDPEGEQLMNRMMALVMELTRPEKNRQQNKAPELLPPCRTLYINNLNEKVDTGKLETDLRGLFSKYGDIVDFSALKSFWRRGQAFVTFQSLESAQKALEALQGSVYEGKPMRINFARKESWEHDPSRRAVKQESAPAAAPSDPGRRKPHGIQLREKALQEEFLSLQQDLIAYQRNLVSSNEDRAGKRFSLSLAKTPNEKRAKIDGVEPHRILFCEGLSDDVAEVDLITLFKNETGFERVRHIPAKHVAFVDFKTVEDASAALQAVHPDTFRVTYAKR